MNSRNVIVFTNTIPRFILDFNHFLRYIARYGFRTTLYAPATSRETSTWMYREEIVADWVEKLPPGSAVRALPYDRERLSVLDLLRTIVFSRRLAKQDPGALVMFWTILPMIICGLPMRALGMRCVFMATGLGSAFGSDRFKYRLARPFVKLVYRYLLRGRNSRTIVHNPEDREFLSRSLGVKSEHIMVTWGCGADPEEFPYFPDLPRRSKKVILVPSRLLLEKGILEAAEASRILRDRGIEHEMRFTSSIDSGNPSALRQQDLDRIERENDCVKFIGYQPAMAPLYEHCDIVCLPSWYREGLPSPLIEAAACGRPAVACNIIGSREIVEDGVTGLMVPPRSAPALADALERLIGDDDLADTLRKNAHRRYLEKFTKDDMVARTVDVFRSLEADIPRLAAQLRG
jgi:glycosyltransferase involved in cell wall biosynthesis